MLQNIANTIRSLTMDAIEFAGSGHPGLPMGCAELGAYLYGEFLQYNPLDPSWIERDRVILSAGHGSLWLYSCLHLAGFEISIDDLKRFRQIDSITPSHPDITKTNGVEATTGLDGQGIGNGVGQSLALKFSNLSAKVIVLAGDGCLMEGVSYEACSLAGHLCLDNLILIYDCNKTTLDGYVDESFSECIELRFRSQGWDIIEIDGHDLDLIKSRIRPLRDYQHKPTLVVAHTEIGKGSPNKEGTPLAHGTPLGAKEISLTKKKLQVPDEAFHVPAEVYSFFLDKVRTENRSFKKLSVPVNLEKILNKLSFSEQLAGRWTSHEVLQEVAKHVPYIIVGSADLSSSDGTFLKDSSWVSKENFSGRNIKYGVREFAMGAIAAGMSQTKLVLPVIGTFLVFSDYMKSAIRMICLQKLRVIFHLTHDSIFIGQDGPTHQPLEQIANLRALPELLVLRPGDPHEIKMSWVAALKHEGPSALILARQDLPALEKEVSYNDGVGKGAYIIREETEKDVDYLLIATGSEIHLALSVADELGPACRVVSMPSHELFEKQSRGYKEFILQGKTKVSIEAGTEQGWHKYIGKNGIAISLSSFGESGLSIDIANKLGFTKEKILNKIKSCSKLNILTV